MLARRNLPFEKALRTIKINRMAEGAITPRGNQVIETNINMVNSKVRFNIIAEGNFNMEVQQHRVNTSLENLKEVPFTNNSKLVPLASMTLIHLVVRKLFTEEIPNVPLAGRLSQFVKQWEQITRDQEILSIVKGYQTPFTNLPVQEKPPNTIEMSKQQSLLVNQEISELLEKGAIQKVETGRVVRQPLRVSLPVLWFRASPKSFYQITKNPNCSFETKKHSNNCLSFTDGVDLTENYDSEGYIDFSVAKFGVCHKSEKVNPTISETIRISGVTDRGM